MSIHYGGRGPGHIARVQGAGPTTTFNLASALDSRITFSRSTTGTYVDSAGVIQTAAIDAARFDYDPNTLAARGLLVEGAFAQVITQPVNYSDAYWSRMGAAAITANQTVADPAGGTTASTLRAGSGTYDGIVNRVTGYLSHTSGSTYMVAAFVKKGNYRYVGLRVANSTNVDRYPTYDFDTDTLNTQGVTGAYMLRFLYPNGWVKVCLFMLAATTDTTPCDIALTQSNGNVNYAPAGTETVHVWGINSGVSTVHQSYVASAMTRAADIATVSTLSPWFNASQGTFVVSGDSPAIGSLPLIALDDNTANERMSLYTSGTDPKFIVVDGGSTVADIDAGAITANTAFKLAAAYKLNDCAASVNGAAAVPDPSATLPTVDRLRIGSNQAGAYLGGHIKRIDFYNARKTDAQLAGLSA